MRFPNLNTSVVARIREYIHHLANGGDMVADLLMAMLSHRIISGGIIATPTTANVQATGAAGNLAWRVNTSYFYGAGDADYHELVAQVDTVIQNAASPITATPPQSIVAAVVVKKAANGVKSIITVKGTAALTSAGVPVGPTDAAIQTAVGAGLTWWKLGEVQLDRTSDLVVVETYFQARGDRGVWLANF